MSDLMYLEAGCDTQTFELAVTDVKIFFLLHNYVFGVRSICKTTIASQWHVPVRSDEMYCSARRDTQAFELAVMGKNLSL